MQIRCVNIYDVMRCDVMCLEMFSCNVICCDVIGSLLLTLFDIFASLISDSPDGHAGAGPSFVFTVTKKGYGKLVLIDEFRTARRGGMGVTAIKFKDKAGGGGRASRKDGKSDVDVDSLSCMRVCSPGDEVQQRVKK